MSSVLAIDPGETTGLAWCDWEVFTDIEREVLVGDYEMGQIDGSIKEQAFKIGRGMAKLQSVVVISESSDHFLLRGGKALRKSSLVPIKLEGAIDAVVGIMNGNFERSSLDNEQKRHDGWMRVVHVTQTPGQAKSVLKDGVLRAYGFPRLPRQERHQVDALRHLLLARRRYKVAKQTEMQNGRPGFANMIDEGVRW